MHRRTLLGAAGALAAAWPNLGRAEPLPFAPQPLLARMRATPDRLIDLGVCLRPFRAQGPRIEAETRHGRTIVHHYGHGGSGWSLSWGSARLGALPLILSTRQRRIAVVGCGAIGLTTARVAQQAGLRVRIYCRERPPEIASSLATGVWTPDSRICTREHATPAFAVRWEAMARRSFHDFQQLLGLPGSPVDWRDGYVLSDQPFNQPLEAPTDEPAYPYLESRLAGLRPRSVALAPEQHPFRVAHARRFTQLVFHVRLYQRLLLEDFLREGGELVQRDFTSPRQFAGLPERTIVNCTGYGARALFGDETLIPVRGQTARLVPQPEVDYVLHYRGHNLMVVPRHDGILVQAQAAGDFGNDDTRVDRALSEAAVARLAGLFV